MKKYLLLSVICLCFLACSSPTRSIDRFIDIHKEQRHAYAVTIPGWLIRSGTNWASRFAEGQDEQAYYSLGQYIKKLRVLVISEQSLVQQTEFSQLIKNAKSEGNYEEYVTVRKPDGLVNVMVSQVDNIVKGLLVIANEEESFAIVNLKTDLPLHIFEQTDFSFLKDKEK